ncbi:MAG: branched-chain amino acid ABC transporter permease [Thermodesulfobacteriota bacterium]|jgi:branched-chain amino acid transport system permease protein
MSLELFVQLLVNGLMSGGMYALVASGFTLILGVIQVFNFAQGEFYMLGAFITYGVVSALGLPYPVAIVAALLGVAILGVLFHFAVIQRTMLHGFFHTMLVTVAFGSLVNQTSLLTFGFRNQVVPPVFSGTVTVGGLTLNPGKLLVIAGALVVMMALYYFMKTKMGTAMLAATENREVAGLQGINAKKVFWITMGVGSALCGVAGALVVPVLSASTTMGANVFTRSMLVVLVGGTGSMAGALLAAFLVGILESFAFQFVGQFSLLAIFVFVAVLMFFRPGGLLGKPLPIPGQ